MENSAVEVEVDNFAVKVVNTIIIVKVDRVDYVLVVAL